MSTQNYYARWCFIILHAAVFGAVLPSIARAQYAQEVRDLRSASDQYDERGYEGSKGISVDGSLVVNSSNGGVSYLYPLSHQVIGGYSVDATLNYAGSISFTMYRQYNMAHKGLGTVYDGWQKFSINRPAWIIGVNGFAVNCLTTSTAYHPDSTSRAFRKNIHDFTDGDFVATVDGYDVCNRMVDFNPVSGGSGSTVDVIHLLRADGSLLTLTNKQPYIGDSSIDARETIYTGYYIEDQANSSGYGVVEYDSTYWPQYIQEYLQGRGEIARAGLVPRRLRFYPGNGLEYVFREWVMGYGAGPYLDNESVSGGVYASPSIFYLEEIRSNAGQIVTFTRARHYPISGNPIFQSLNDNTRGRALITSWENHEINFGYNSLLIEALGRTTKVMFDTVLRGGTAGPRETMPWANAGTMSSMAKELATLPESDKRLYGTYTGYVTKIIDPQNRVTTFDYEPYTRVYQDFNFPFPNDNGMQRLTFTGYRLKEVREPDTRYHITYRPASSQPITPDKLSPDHLPQFQATLNDMVDSVDRYDTFGTLLTTDKYYPDLAGKTGMQRTIDRIDGSERTITQEYATHVLGNLAPLMPPTRHTTLVRTTEQAADRTTVTTTIYARGHDIPGSGGRAGNYLILPAHTWSTTNGIVTGFQKFSYTLDTIRRFGGNDELAGRFGMEVSRKVTRNLRPDDTSRVLTIDTVEYLHLPGIDTMMTWTETRWKKLSSLENFFHYRDIGDPRVAGRRWEDVGYSEPVAVFGTDTITGRVTVPPMLDLVRAAWTSDSSDIVAGRKNVYRTEVSHGGWRELRGSLLADSIIVRGGRTIPGSTYEYVQDWGTNLLHATRDAQGTETQFRYASWDVNPGQSMSLPDALVLTNDDTVTARTIEPNAFPLWYEKPLVTSSIVRRWADTGLVHDTLSTVTERTYYGLVTGTRDANGWYSRADYDRNGRLITAWQPGDFPRAADLDTIYEGTRVGELYGFSLYNRRPDILHCEKDPVTGAVTSWVVPGVPSTTLHSDTLVAALPVTQMPHCQCVSENQMPVKEDDHHEGKGDDRQLLRFCNFENIPFNTNAGYAGIYGLLPCRLDSANPLVAAARVDSLILELMIAHVDGECVHLEVAVDGIFAQTFVLNCESDHGSGDDDPKGSPVSGSSLTPVAGGYALRVNMTPAADALGSHGQEAYFDIKLRVKTPGAAVAFLDGTNAEDLRPKLIVKGGFHEIEERADYTARFDHNDQALTTTALAKIDDLHHTENVLDGNDAFGGAVRRTVSRHYFGADDRLLTSEERKVEHGAERYDLEHFVYTGFGARRAVTDADGNTAQMRYDAAGRPVETINTDGSRTQVSYQYGHPGDLGITDQDFLGFASLEISTDENGIRTAKYADALGRLRRVIDDVDGARLEVRNEYDMLGRLTHTVTPKGDTIAYTYDDFGRIRTETHPDCGTVSMAYDDEGNLRFSQTQEQATARRLTFHEYDDLGRLTLVGEARIDWNQGIAGKRMTDVPNPNTIRDGGAGSILTANRTLLDVPKRLVPTIPPGFAFRYCELPADTALGETQSPPTPLMLRPAPLYPDIAMPAATMQDFEHIARYPEFGRQGIAYDTLPEQRGAVWGGFPTHTDWARLMPTGRVRNLRGRTAAVATRERPGEPYEYTVYSYDARGHVEAEVRFTESLGFDAVYNRYNASNAVTRVTVADPFRQYTTFYGYDYSGRVDSVWTAMGGFGQGLFKPGVGMIYPQPLVRPDVPDIVYDYTRTNQVARMSYPPVAIEVRHVFGVRKWLDSVVAVQRQYGTDVPVFTQLLEHDASGQILAQQWRHGAGALQRQSYTYDNADRLIGWRMGIDSTGYHYDRAGNRTEANTNGHWRRDEYTYQPGTDRIIDRVRTGGLGDVRTTLYDYDPDGAIIQRTHIDFTNGNGVPLFSEQSGYGYRDLENTHRRLTPIQPGGPLLLEEEWRYRWSPSGERNAKRRTYKRGTNAVPAPFKFQPRMYYLLGMSSQQLAVFHGRETEDPFCSDVGQRAYYYPREYLTYAVDYTGTMEDVSRVLTHPNGSKQYRISDHLASLRATVDSGVIETYDYDPWGTPIAQPGGERSRRTYNDRERDRESGTYNNGVRQLSDDEGRFGAVDKLWDAAPGLSPYVYGNNNPLRYTDPTGLQGKDVETNGGGCGTVFGIGGALPPNGGGGVGPVIGLKDWIAGIGTAVAAGTVYLLGSETQDQYKEAEKDATHQPGYTPTGVQRQHSTGVDAIGGGGGAVAATRMGAKPQSNEKGAPKKSGTDGKSSKGKNIAQAILSLTKHPESASHATDAQKSGHPSKLTIDRKGSSQRRAESLKGHATIKGKDRDEYPPAMFKEGGTGASVRHISPSDNRGAGSSLGHQLRGYPDGTVVKIKVVD